MAEHRGCFRAAKPGCMVLSLWIHTTVCLSQSAECTTPGVTPDVNCGLWVILPRQRRFINGNKRTPLVTMGKAVLGLGVGWGVGQRFMGNLCTSSSIFLLT